MQQVKVSPECKCITGTWPRSQQTKLERLGETSLWVNSDHSLNFHRPLSYCMTLCLWVMTSIPVSICLTSAFVLFPFYYMDFQNHFFNENRCLSWWSIQNTTLFLLHFSTLPWIAVFIYMQVKDTFTWEVTNKSRIAPEQTAAKPVKKLLWRVVSRISLTSNQIPQLLHASIFKEIPQTPRLLIRSLTAQVSPTWTRDTKQCRLVLVV